MRVEGKVWVVTGGGNGIGRELVLELLRRRGRVAAVDVRPESLAETARIAGAYDALSTHVVDITDEAAADALVDEVIAAHGAVDGVINNAGIVQPFVSVEELDVATIRRLIEVNLMGTVHLVKAFLPALLERPEAHVVNVSSMGGYLAFPMQTMYGATKAAVKLMSEGLYAELSDTGVRVTVVMPGAVKTSITDNSGVGGLPGADLAEESNVPMTTPDKAARTTLDGVERDRLHVYVGPDARLTSLAVKVAPRLAIRAMKKLMARTMEPA